MTTRQRWSALPGFSETNKSKPKQMATDAAADALPTRSDRDGLFDKPAETSWIPNPSPSHPYDRAKAHNKRVAIMRCPILSVEWHFPPQSSGSLTITQQIMQRLHSGERDGSAARRPKPCRKAGAIMITHSARRQNEKKFTTAA